MLDSVFDSFNNGQQRVLCIAPTGVGKSAVMGGLASHYLKVRPNAVVLVLSHLGLLIEQSGNSFMDFFSLETDILQAQTYPYADSQCILSTVQSASIKKKIDRFIDRLPIGRKVELILLDEAHRNSGVSQVDKILYEYFPDAKVTGLTGSPFKQNKDMSSLFDNVSYSVSLREVIAMGYLVPPRIHGIEVDKKDLEDVMSKVISSIHSSHNRDKTITFMKTMKEARLMAQALRDVGYNATVITSDVDPEIRSVILQKFRDNTEDSHQHLITVDVLSVGFDAPALQAIYMPYGTNSVSQFLQRLGRVLRTCRETNKQWGDVYMGGADPRVEQGKWERVKELAERAGEDGVVEDITIDEVERELEEMKEEPVQTEDNIMTIELANLKKKFEKDGMDNLATVIGDRDFPEEFLDHLIAVDTSTKVKSKAKATAKQKELIAKRGIDATGFNKTEASVAIDAIASKENWTTTPKRIVPVGQFKGKEANDVPWAYKARVTKATSKYYNAELAEFFKGR